MSNIVQKVLSVETAATTIVSAAAGTPTQVNGSVPAALPSIIAGTAVAPAADADHVEWLLGQLRLVLNNGPPNVVNIIDVIQQGIVLLRNFGGLTDQQRKNTLVAALHALVPLIPVNTTEQAVIDNLISVFGVGLVDSLYYFATNPVKMTLTRFGCWPQTSNPV